MAIIKTWGDRKVWNRIVNFNNSENIDDTKKFKRMFGTMGEDDIQKILSCKKNWDGSSCMSDMTANNFSIV